MKLSQKMQLFLFLTRLADEPFTAEEIVVGFVYARRPVL